MLSRLCDNNSESCVGNTGKRFSRAAIKSYIGFLIVHAIIVANNKIRGMVRVVHGVEEFSKRNQCHIKSIAAISIVRMTLKSVYV